jgi:membrane associated rhomboid family serine protease
MGYTSPMPAFPQLDFNRTPATLLVAAVATALEIAFLLDDVQEGTRRLDMYNSLLGILPRLWAGELWRPFTSTLMHAGLLHAAFNLYWLLLFGIALELRLGSYRMLGLMVLLGYVSMMPEYCVGSYRREEPVMIVGLSGIVYGLFGLLWMGRRWHPEMYVVCDRHTAQLLLGWFFLCIFLTYANILPVANIAHGAGFGFGVLYAHALWSPRHRRKWFVATCLITVLVLATLLACPGHVGFEHVRRTGRLWWHW